MFFVGLPARGALAGPHIADDFGGRVLPDGLAHRAAGPRRLRAPFEHMMFQGSQNLGKMEFIKLVEQNGGILNGSTRFD